MFFHIPFLIAHHLNANSKFKEAKWWYERIFNPTGDEMPAVTRPTDHNWQFRQFRGLGVEKLEAILADTQALEAYRTDPFSPHAIARLRLNAYQKAIVMKYIDNLIDWGDNLFAQDTRESITEAEMLYQLASDILGRRPVKMGVCETAADRDLTYERIAPEIGTGSEFLITLENVYVRARQYYGTEVEAIKASKHLGALLKKEEPSRIEEVAEATHLTRLSDLVAAGETSASRVAPEGTGRRRIEKHEDKVRKTAGAKARAKNWIDK